MRASDWTNPIYADPMFVPPLPDPLPDADDPFAVEKWLYLLLQHMSKVEAIVAPQAQNKWQEGNAVKWSYQGNLGLGLVQFVFPVELLQIHFLPGASLAALDLLED